MATLSAGNIVGTVIFRPQDAHAYIPGKIANMASHRNRALVVAYILRRINIRLNKQRQKELAEKRHAANEVMRMSGGKENDTRLPI